MKRRERIGQRMDKNIQILMKNIKLKGQEVNKHQPRSHTHTHTHTHTNITVSHTAENQRERENLKSYRLQKGNNKTSKEPQ